jgi:hypothetical protein
MHITSENANFGCFDAQRKFSHDRD